MANGPKGHTTSPINTTDNNRISLDHTRAAAPITSEIFLDLVRCPGPRSGRQSRRPQAVLDSGTCREDPPVRVGGPRPTQEETIRQGGLDKLDHRLESREKAAAERAPGAYGRSMGIPLADRQELLAQPLIAALSVSRESGRGPLTVPIW